MTNSFKKEKTIIIATLAPSTFEYQLLKKVEDKEEDFVRILTEPEASLIKQYIALMATEDFTLDFTEEAINQLAKLAAEINGTVENIGARRLHTVLEKLLEEISFSAADRSGETVTIDADMVNNRVGDLLKVGDLTKFIL